MKAFHAKAVTQINEVAGISKLFSWRDDHLGVCYEGLNFVLLAEIVWSWNCRHGKGCVNSSVYECIA